MQLLLVCAIAAAFMTSNNMVDPLAPLAASALHASPALVGLVIGAGSLAPLALAVPAGAFTDRVGSKRLTVPSLLAIVAGTGLTAGNFGLGGLTLGLVLKGLGQFGGTLGLQAFVAHIPGRSRNETFAIFAVAAAVGGLCGPALAGALAARSGLSTAFWWATGLAALAAGLGFLIDGRTADGSGVRVRPRATLVAAGQLLRTPAIGTAVWTTSAILFADVLTGSFYPVLLAQRGVALGTIGLLISLRGLASFAVRPSIAGLTRRMDRWWLVVAAMAAEVVGTATVPLSAAMALQIPAALLCGVATGFNQPLSMAVVADHAPPGQRSSALAMRLAGNRMALLLSPLLLGLVVTGFGLPAAFAVAALFPLGAAVYVLRFQARGGEAAATRHEVQSAG
ncbi:MAG TPA: MFS transporter [Bacillota bacterium]|nr:MFS transporter [Bacillota bacterium]